MWRRAISRVLVIGLICISMVRLASAQVSPRVPNASLRLPLFPPSKGFSTAPAFPGVTFVEPVQITSIPGETNRVFIVERAGRVIALTNFAAPTLSVVLDKSSQVDVSGEGGMLGLSFHPDFANNRSLFISYSLLDTNDGTILYLHRLSRFRWSSDGEGQIDAASEAPLITQRGNSYHRGGDVKFGPDGYLYWSRGDGANSVENSQRIDKDFFSAILRIDVDNRPGSLPSNPHPASHSGYRIPPDNPFVGAAWFNGSPVNPDSVRTEIYAIGLRNPWRFSFDPLTGWLYCGDVGQQSREEIDIITKGGNYGWTYFEGNIPFNGTPPQNQPLIPPIIDFTNWCAITGGIVYRGQKLPDLYGDYIFADYCGMYCYALRYDGAQVTNIRRLTISPNVVDFGSDPHNGDILLVSLDGKIDRLVYSGAESGDPLPEHLDQTGAFTDLASLQPAMGILPYTINNPFWSDRAIKRRWVSIPDTNHFFGFDPIQSWQYPTGTVWIKHFEMEMTNGIAESRRRLETRFLVRNPAGVYGITYRWDEEQTNATLVAAAGMDERLAIFEAGDVRTQIWRYPARSECLNCHSSVGGLALGFSTAQLNCEVTFGDFITNQILGWSAMGYLTNAPSHTNGLLALAPATNETVSLEVRARSFLAANCAACHQPGGSGSGRGGWDARFTTPLEEAGIINGELAEDLGDPANRVLVPGDVAHSVLIRRLAEMGPLHMPPLATSVPNTEAVHLLSRWMEAESAVEIAASFPNLDGMITFSITGQPRRRYRVETSANLLTWQTYSSIETDVLGHAEITTGSPITRQEFFRVVWP